MPLKLRVVFDFSCPYCYIAWGYIRKLKETIPFQDEWMTWEIHPDVSPQGADIGQLIPTIDFAQRRHKLNNLGASVALSPGDTTFVPNTRLALEAVEFAAAQGKDREWRDAIFKANFADKRNIGDKNVLLDIARTIGLPVEELDHALTAGTYTADIFAHDKECSDKHVEWVPTIFIEDNIVLEGAFTYEELERVVIEHSTLA